MEGCGPQSAAPRLRPGPYGPCKFPSSGRAAPSLLGRPGPAALGAGPLSAQVAMEMSLPVSQPQQGKTTKSCPFSKAPALQCLDPRPDPQPEVPSPEELTHRLWASLGWGQGEQAVCSWFSLWDGVGWCGTRKSASPLLRRREETLGWHLKKGTYLPSVVPGLHF